MTSHVAATPDELTLRSDELRVVVAPARGGRIASLVHTPTQRELLWRQPPLPGWPRYGVPESTADIQGWDECCPAIGPGLHDDTAGPWADVPNPAQGEVYALPWQVRDAGERHAIMAVHGLRFPYELERELRLVEPCTLRLRYRIANHAALPFPFIWSAHPLLDASVGARIVLPDGVREAIIDSSEGERLGRVYGTVAWPVTQAADGSETDLSRIEPGSAWGDKLYVTAVAEGNCALLRADGLTVRMAWDAAAIPYLGVWIDTRGAGEARVALEPCLGYPDLMAQAAQWGRHAVLPPHGEQSWEMTVTVSVGAGNDQHATP